MKKTAIFMLAMLPAMMGWSQDTIDSPFKKNYFFNNEIDLGTPYVMTGITIMGDGCGINTKEMYLGDSSLTVYGIAAAMVTDWDKFYIPAGEDPTERLTRFFSEFPDTSTENLFEYLGIYFRSGDSLVPQREVMVHRRYDTPAYYVETGMWVYNNPNFVYPMYEKYFDSAIVITEQKFYVGTTQYTIPSYIGVSQFDHMNFTALMMSSPFRERHVGKYCWPDEGNVYWNWRGNGDYEYYLFFPILTPEPDTAGSDTTGTGGDTLAVTQADMVGRYVSVQPNPAVDEARVLSSFGLERIEAYNAEGRLVFKQEATGLEATLDVKGWPRGTYLLRIQTPMGAVTKKLLVQ